MFTKPNRFMQGALALLLTALFFAPPATAGWQAVAGPLPNDPMGVRIYRLDNGLEVHVSENHDSPRFFAEIAVRTGSKYDPVDSTGLAHYMEHLLFKGSERLGTADFAGEKAVLDRIDELYERHFHETDPQKRAQLYQEINAASEAAARFAIPNELDRLYKVMGGRNLNAHTWHEEVVYQVDLPANRLEQWAAVESDRFKRPVFRLFQTELETVYEEMNRALDNKFRVIQVAVDAVLYKNHPYGQKPTLGTVAHLKNPSLKNLHTFYETWYVPNNMAVFISGDVRAEEAVALVDRYFADWAPRELPECPVWEEGPLRGREVVRVPFDAEEFVMLAFRTTPRNHADAPALEMVDMLLDNATAGLINLNLNQAQRTAGAGAFPLMLNDYGAQYLYGVPKPGQTMEEVEGLLLEQLEHIKKGEFDDWLPGAIVNDHKKNEKAGLESDESRVDRMRSAWIGMEPWEHAVDRISRMEKVTRDDVVRVANQYFGGNYVAGFREDAPRRTHPVEKPPLPKIEIDASRQSPFASSVLAMPAPPIEPVFIKRGRDYEKKEDGRGVTLFHAPNPVNDIFTFTIAVARGVHEDPLAAVAERLMRISGTERLSSGDLQKEWYKLGASFSVSSGDHETVFSLTGLDENFEKALGLLMELAWTPKVEDAALEQLKAILLQQRDDARKEQDTLAAALVDYNREGKDSYFLKMPPAERVMSLTAGELQGVIRGILSSRQTVCYTGTLPMDAVMDALRRLHPVKGLLDDTPPYKRPEIRAPETTEILFVQKESAQAHIQIEFGGVPYDPRMSPQVQLYNSYFADGMAGIVFQELREARALAYVAGARYLPGYRKGDKNLMMGLIQTQPDKTADALAAFAELLDNMPREEQRFDAAREAVINSYRTGKTGFRAVLDTVCGWERRGILEDPRPAWYKAVRENGTLDSVAAFQERHIAGKPKLVSIVGDRARVNMDALRQFGPVTELTVDDIMVK